MREKKVALIGNPNTGKSSLFNLLTGLHQHVGNFPGVTVDKKIGSTVFDDGSVARILDLPGIYSVYHRSEDERVVTHILGNPANPDFPDQIIMVADSSNLERNLLLCSQILEYSIPVILVMTMDDVARQRSLEINPSRLSAALGGIPVLFVNGRTGDGLDQLKALLMQAPVLPARRVFGDGTKPRLLADPDEQAADAEERYRKIRGILATSLVRKSTAAREYATSRLDKILVHRIWGYVIFMAILLIIFQFIFSIASYPMDWIDGAFLQASQALKDALPGGVLTNLLAEGIVPGIGGVVVFIPQIALLFFFLSLLEESGYMARVVFIMDRLVRPFGLNGKSVVPLMSSVACAIPGIMSARGIPNARERLITILIAPLMSCSARIPVYTLLIALVVPSESLWGIFNLQGLALFSLYCLGLFAALAVSWVLHRVVKTGEAGFLLMELPVYQWPRWRQVGLTLWEKVRVFVLDAGKVILAISIVLWAMASFGPADRLERAISQIDSTTMDIESYERAVNAARLENSYIGIVGHAIEPVIRPLGYDWKIGIALLTSFAAREVFVGSMATIYSVNEDFEGDHSLLERLRNERNPDTGEQVYSLATGSSLMIFYVFAMQCMATFAVVKRETRSWKWPLFQMAYMGVLAYAAAFITFQLLS